MVLDKIHLVIQCNIPSYKAHWVLIGQSDRRPALTHSFDGAERRKSQRCPIDCQVIYKDSAGTGPTMAGRGQSLNLSRNGLLFTTEQQLQPGKKLEVAISWPAKLDGACQLKLVSNGRVVRVQGSQAAMEVNRFEFKTTSAAAFSCSEK